MTIYGRCQCGGVAARIAGEPVAVRQCWCRQCQQLAAGSPTNNAIFRAEDIDLSGALATHSYTAASGNLLTQSFCPTCGTPVMGQSSARPEYRAVRLGFLEPGHNLAPLTAIWVSDAPEWGMIDPALEQVARQPGAPGRS